MELTANNTRYSINAHDEIVDIGGDWDRFARENDSPPECFSANVIHRCFWDFVSGEAVRHVYRSLIMNVRAGRSFDFAFRCDSPRLRRFMTMQIKPGPAGGVDFVTELFATEERDFQRVFDINAKRSDALVVACSWCNKLRVGETVWTEPENAIRPLTLFEDNPVPALSHGMCESCYAAVMDKASRR